MIGCGVGSTLTIMGGPTALPIQVPGADFIPVGPWNTDGLIVIGPLYTEPGNQYFQGLIDSGFPLVYAGDRETAPSVIVDNEGGVREAMDHLFAHGHRKIAFIAGYPIAYGDTSGRFRGYKQSLEQHGLPYDPELIAYGYHSQMGGNQAMKEILARGAKFSAVVASNDESALGAIEAIHAHGLMVPQDIAVIGFDDRLEARAHIPLLTSVHHPMLGLGYQTTKLLVQIIEGTAPLNSLLRIPTHLVIRESCGCLPGADYSNERLLNQVSIPLPPSAPEACTTPAPPEPVNSQSAPSLPTIIPDHKTAVPVNLQDIAHLLADKVFYEMQRMTRQEVEYLCYRLVDAFKLSLMHGNPTTFRLAIQQILEHVANTGDDLYTWQGAVTVLKENITFILNTLPYILPQDQIENMLHQARIAISEVARGQYSRTLVNRSNISNSIGMMTSHFFTARTETEIFEELVRDLPDLGVQRVAVGLYEADHNDLFTWSNLKVPSPPAGDSTRFMTREFPGHGLFSEDHPFQLAIVPLIGQEGPMGFAAFEATNLEPLGAIARQLVAALRGVTLYQDAVSARKMAEESRREAEEANYLKSRYLSIVSHELRTPLNLIYGLSNMMLEESREVSKEESLVNRKDLQRIFIGAQHLESLIRDVLDLARSDMKQLNLVCEPLDLHEILTPISVFGEHLARDKELDWQITVPEALPLVSGDRTRLRQVILNLVNNAVKFTASGKVGLLAETTGSNVLIQVIDTGLGIPLDEQEAIFDEFHQSQRTTARGFGGLGLGLAISKRLVEMHNGRIYVSSSGEEGSGSTFSIELPVFESIESPSAPIECIPCTQRVLLLVKDPVGGEKLMKHLACQGFHVEAHTVNDCCDWHTWLKPTPPDKVVLDLELTSEHGWEILKTLKEKPSTREIPVLFYALENDQDAGSLLDLNFLTKPLNTTDLADELLSRGLTGEKSSAENDRSILVVDDDPDILDLHTRILKTMASGYRIIQAHDGREALAIIRKERPALVLLDLMMPEVDGFTVLETMQSEELIRSIPVIVLTSQVLTEEDMTRLNCGVVSVLSKNMFSAQETLVHVSAALSRKRRPGSETQRMVLKAMAFIHEHYIDPISRGNIADYVGVSERHLARCFQQEIGLSPIVYLNRFRVRIAKALLNLGKMSITDVAMEVGFSAGGYFTRVFRDEVGQSPREYLKDRIR